MPGLPQGGWSGRRHGRQVDGAVEGLPCFGCQHHRAGGLRHGPAQPCGVQDTPGTDAVHGQTAAQAVGALQRAGFKTAAAVAHFRPDLEPPPTGIPAHALDGIFGGVHGPGGQQPPRQGRHSGRGVVLSGQDRPDRQGGQLLGAPMRGRAPQHPTPPHRDGDHDGVGLHLGPPVVLGMVHAPVPGGPPGGGRLDMAGQEGLRGDRVVVKKAIGRFELGTAATGLRQRSRGPLRQHGGQLQQALGTPGIAQVGLGGLGNGPGLVVWDRWHGAPHERFTVAVQLGDQTCHGSYVPPGYQPTFRTVACMFMNQTPYQVPRGGGAGARAGPSD
jgi:hypothetical protein